MELLQKVYAIDQTLLKNLKNQHRLFDAVKKGKLAITDYVRFWKLFWLWIKKNAQCEGQFLPNHALPASGVLWKFCCTLGNQRILVLCARVQRSSPLPTTLTTTRICSLLRWSDGKCRCSHLIFVSCARTEGSSRQSSLITRRWEAISSLRTLGSPTSSC